MDLMLTILDDKVPKAKSAGDIDSLLKDLEVSCDQIVEDHRETMEPQRLK